VGKGNKPAVIPLVPRTARTIDLAIGERTSGPILLRHDGNRLDRRTAHRWVRSIAKRAGIGAVHPHMLRAAFIMCALEAGNPAVPHDVSSRSGHCAIGPPALLGRRAVRCRSLDYFDGASNRVGALDVAEELHHPGVGAGAGACVRALATVERPPGAAVSDDPEGLVVVVRQGDEADSATFARHGDRGPSVEVRAISRDPGLSSLRQDFV
jgi:hypothetical protein